MSIIGLKACRKNYKLPTLPKDSASHTDRSNSLAPLPDTHGMSRIDMLGNSIFSELIVYLWKLVSPITGMRNSCTYFPPEARDVDGFFILRRASGRSEKMLMFKQEGTSLLFLPTFLWKSSLLMRCFNNPAVPTNRNLNILSVHLGS